MSYHTRLLSEINTILDALAEDGRPWQASWIANEICGQHHDGLTEGEHADFWLHCGYSDCRREVTRCINSRAGDRPERDEQYTLPGFEHLQAYYVVVRDDGEVGLPVADLTDEELEGKASLYRAMGAACFRHADELDRYRKLRSEAQAA